MTSSKRNAVAYWVFTALFAAQIAFTAYAQLFLPQVAQVFAHLGFPNYFRIELTWLKFAAVLVLLTPVPARLKEWAYAGLAFTLASALIAHLAVGDPPAATVTAGHLARQPPVHALLPLSFVSLANV